jgi:hypothetical protein
MSLYQNAAPVYLEGVEQSLLLSVAEGFGDITSEYYFKDQLVRGISICLFSAKGKKIGNRFLYADPKFQTIIIGKIINTGYDYVISVFAIEQVLTHQTPSRFALRTGSQGFITMEVISSSIRIDIDRKRDSFCDAFHKFIAKIQGKFEQTKGKLKAIECQE